MTKEQKFIQEAFIEKADEINDFADCDVIAQNIEAVRSASNIEALKESCNSLYVSFYLLSILKELK